MACFGRRGVGREEARPSGSAHGPDYKRQNTEKQLRLPCFVRILRPAARREAGVRSPLYYGIHGRTRPAVIRLRSVLLAVASGLRVPRRGASARAGRLSARAALPALLAVRSQ